MFLFFFSLEYTGRKKWVEPKYIVVGFVVPIFNLILVWTSQFHNLFYEKLELNSIGVLAEISIAGNGGPAFAFHSIYSYLLVIMGSILILYQITKLHRSYLKEGLILASAPLIPLLGNVFYLAGQVPITPDYDITPLLFLIAGTVYSWGILSFRILEIIPVARDAVFENIRESAFVVDMKKRIADLNTAAKRMMEEGYLSSPSGPYIGSQIDEVFPEEADFSAAEDESSSEIELESGNEIKYFHVLISPLYDERDELIAKVIILRDITNRVNSEKRQEFLHSLLRHDLRNKVTVIDGYIELLQENELSEEEVEIVERIASATEDSLNLIEKVRTLRKISEEKGVKEVNVGSHLEAVIDESESKISEKDIDFSLESCEGIKVRGSALLGELFSNLIENSIRHSNCSLIKISAKETEDECIISVEDDGKGIPDEKKEHIFEKGYKIGETAGSGLGTYLVKQIAQSYGGGVEVGDSELGGARFDVHLQKVNHQTGEE